MKICIVGSNSFNNYPLFDDIMNKLIKKIKLNDIEFVIPKDKYTTNAQEWNGINNLAQMYCNYTLIELTTESPDWADLNHPDAIIKNRNNDPNSRYNSNAFNIRNEKMIREADFVVLIYYKDKPDPLRNTFIHLCKKYNKIQFLFEL
jgi:hypothetical protein